MSIAPRVIAPGSYDLAVAGIDVVDVEIREVIAAINGLPCVVRTWHSCAGFGRAGTASRNPDDHPADDATGHYPGKCGYVSVEYDADSSWRATDDRLRQVFDWFGLDFRHHEAFPGATRPGSFRAKYYIDGRGRDDAYMREAWARVLEAVLAPP